MRTPLRIRYSIGLQVGLATGAGCGAFAASHCAALVVRRGPELMIASATAIERCGRYFLATAGHSLAGLENDCDLYIVPPMSSEAKGIPFRGRGSSQGRGSGDLGWIELDAPVALASGLRFLVLDRETSSATPAEPSHHRAAGQNAAGQNVIGQDATGHRVLVHGLPSQLASSRSTSRRHRLHLRALGLFSRTLGLCEEDVELRIEYDHRGGNPQRGGLRRLPAAHGMSGGGVWRVSANGETPRLAGLIRAWHRGERELRCVPIEHWLSWLDASRPDLEIRRPRAAGHAAGSAR